MIASRISKASYASNLSPSVALERGAYRMRAPYGKPLSKTLFSRSADSAVIPHQRRERRIWWMPNMAALMLLLALASVSCFGVAYYLLVTRWEARPGRLWLLANQEAQVGPISFEGEQPFQVSNMLDEKFLAYFPHGGFHNQRIAFENALVLARLLNRTLLVPPIRLGPKPLNYQKFDALYRTLVLSDKTGLSHCPQVPSRIPLPFECADYFEYTHLPWTWLIDLTEVTKGQRILQRWNMTHAWVRERFGLSEADVFTVKDSHLYQYRFLDTLTDISPSGHKFGESLYISDLARYTQRLIQVGTLFGSSRLRLKNKTNRVLRAEVRRGMSFTNPMLAKAVQAIGDAMGSQYFGIHLRINDGPFKKMKNLNIRSIWRGMMQTLNYTEEEASFLESSLLEEPSSLGAAAHGVRNFSLERRTPSSALGLRCRDVLFADPRLFRLNTPLYISTDTAEPNVDPALSIIRKTFPCIFHASDFAVAVSPLMELRNADDGVLLGRFLIPFLDAMVLGRAIAVVGTNGSTFSQFVQDILWPIFHEKAVSERG